MITIKELISDAISKAFVKVKSIIDPIDARTRYNDDTYFISHNSVNYKTLQGTDTADNGSWYIKIGPIVYLYIKTVTIYNDDMTFLGNLSNGYYPMNIGNPLEFQLPHGALVFINSSGGVYVKVDPEQRTQVDSSAVSFAVFY